MVRDDHGNPQSVLIAKTDVTERKKLEAQLQRTQRFESIGTLTHDLNNILVPILMLAPLLRGNIAGSDRGKFLEIVQSSAERGADGERVLLQPVYLVQNIARIAESTFPKNITTRTRYHENVRSVAADPAQLHQVLLNLAINARDAMPDGGVLTLIADNFDVDDDQAAATPARSPSSSPISTCPEWTGSPSSALCAR